MGWWVFLLNFFVVGCFRVRIVRVFVFVFEWVGVWQVGCLLFLIVLWFVAGVFYELLCYVFVFYCVYVWVDGYFFRVFASACGL